MSGTQNILVIGCGGREHAIVKALHPLVEFGTPQPNVYVFGPYRNPGIDQLINGQSLSCDDNYYICDINNTEDIQKKLDCLLETLPNGIDFAIIGPEKPLAEGVVDLLSQEPYQIPTLGPKSELAQLEASKIYARDLMQQNPILRQHCPKYKTFGGSFSLDELRDTFKEYNYQFVVKPSNLAGGKGVRIFTRPDDFKDSLNYCLSICIDNPTGFVVEEYLAGEEISLISLSDSDPNHPLLHFPPMQDNKKAYDFDQGPNTGGMGCILLSDHFLDHFLTQEDIQTMQELNTLMINQLPEKYSGFLFGGYMKTKQGEIKILEYNVRLGDPEGINLLHNLDTPDLVTLAQKSLNNQLTSEFIQSVEFKNQNTIVHYVVPSTYPKIGSLPKNQSLSLKNLSSQQINDHIIFAASKYLGNEDYYLQSLRMSKFSRTLAVVVTDPDYSQALQKVRQILCSIEGQIRYRFDIGNKFLSAQSQSAQTQSQSQSQSPSKISYKDAGVDVEEAENSVREIKEKVQQTYNSIVIPNFGGFGGLAKINDTVLVSSIDGTGTKSKFLLRVLPSIETALYNLGRDVFYANLNDIIVVANHVKPLFFLDYYSTRQLKSKELKAFVSGVADACQENNTVLIGGETAEMKIHNPGCYDLVGTIVGEVVPKVTYTSEPPPNIVIGYTASLTDQHTYRVESKNYHYYHKSLIEEGHMVLGIKSNGLHTNGYSLINTLMDKNLLTHDMIQKYTKELCGNHRNYLPFLTEFRNNDLKPKGLCHITGGGLIDNPKRILPDHLTIEWDYDVIIDQMPEFYQVLQSLTNMTSTEEMMRTFNLGYGFLVITTSEDYQKYIDLFPVDMKLLGKVITSARQEDN